MAIKTKASQHPEEMEQMINVVKAIKPKIILEVGTWHGYSADTFRKYLHPEMLITIDTVDYGYDSPWVEKILGASQNVTTLRRVLSLIKDKEIDFAFIDGDHTYDSVKRDFFNYSQLIRKGGIVGLHDVSVKDNPTVEVYKLWAEIKETFNTRTIHYGQGTGTGLVFL